MPDQPFGLGFVNDPTDERDYLWRAVINAERVVLPKKFRVKKFGPVLDQGQEGACVGFATAAVKQWQEAKQHRRFFNFDARDMYHRCKKLDGIPNEEGTYPRVALQLLVDEGIVARAEKYKLKTDTFFKAESFVRLTSMQQIKESIYKYGATLAGIGVDESCYYPNEKFVIGEPDVAKQIGGHAICILGWDDTKKCQNSTGAFLVKNSWGADYGMKGLVWWPYTHFEAYDYDAWQIVDCEDLINA